MDIPSAWIAFEVRYETRMALDRLKFVNFIT